MHYYLVLIFLLSFSFIRAQNGDEDYYSEDYIRYNNHTYTDSIKTIQLHKKGWELGYPIMNIESNDKMQLSFDDLDQLEDTKTYTYTFIHCNANWKPSTLMPNEYIEGFTENEITNYEFSFNTSFDYTHYSLIFPNENVKLTKTGNYIIFVYRNYDKSKPVLTRRFCVAKQKIGIEPVIKKATVFDKSKYCQEIDFTLNTKGLNINDPMGEIKVVLTMNNRWDNAITDLKPLFIKDNEIIYDYDTKNVFYAGSEYRNFDIKSVRYQSQYINNIEYKAPFYHVQLVKNEKRRFKIYFSDKDLNGKYYIEVQEGEDKNTEADYVYVYFRLAYPEPLVTANLYVFGALSDWQFNKKNQLRYNYEKKEYQLRMLLKQGYYNYIYAYVEDGSTVADNQFIEGSHFETENDYVIYVYYRDMSSRYDKLYGFEIINSQRQGLN